MAWTIACYCGHVYKTLEDYSECPRCGASFAWGVPSQAKKVTDRERQQMEVEMETFIELVERGLLDE